MDNILQFPQREHEPEEDEFEDAPVTKIIVKEQVHHVHHFHHAPPAPGGAGGALLAGLLGFLIVLAILHM